MLKLTINPNRYWDPKVEHFFWYPEKPVTLQLEHSLVSLSKWEAKWCKPFLTKGNRTEEEMRDYIRCMTLTQNVDPKIYDYLTEDAISEIEKYLTSPMTATTFSNNKERPSREVITSELIYYWMIAFSIPFECQKWHLNRLMTLIRICSIKNSPQKKMSPGEIRNRNRQLNEARRKSMHTKG